MTIELREPIAAFRAEDLLRAGSPEKWVEIIEGELVAMTPAGWAHNLIALEFILLFRELCTARQDLQFGTDNDGFLLRRDPDVLLSPDASLFRARPRSQRPWMEFAPEVAVEVLSPGNSAAEIAYKKSKYFEAGSEQVWIVRPETRAFESHHRDGRRVIAQGVEKILAEGVAEGIVIDLSSIFSGMNG